MGKINKFIRWVGLTIILVLFLTTILFIEKKRAKKTCQAIDIQVHKAEHHPFIDAQDIQGQIAKNAEHPLLGMAIENLNTKKIENSIKSHKFVKRVVVCKNWQGDLKIEIAPQNPIARIIRTQGPGYYLDEEGTKLPLSQKYTARVLLISADNEHVLNAHLEKMKYNRALVKLLSFIHKNPFWHAQIAHIHIDTESNFTMYTQVSKQKVEFGKPERIEKKFGKLKLFYKYILPFKGWNTYDRVNLAFENQIVCE